MTDRTHPEAGSTHIIRYALELGLLWIDGDGRNKVREALAALDALEAQLAYIGAGGVQALSAAPEAIAKLRHLYKNLMCNGVRGTEDAKRIAQGLLAPAIEALERATPPAERQAAPKAAPVKACVCGEPQAPGTVHRVDGPCYVVAPQQEPALFIGEIPLADLVDPPYPIRGISIAVRKTKDGPFTQPLYTAPQPAPAPLSEQDERRAFEQDFMRVLPGENLKRKFGHYEDPRTRHRWDGWKARAALAAQGGK